MVEVLFCIRKTSMKHRKPSYNRYIGYKLEWARKRRGEVSSDQYVLYKIIQEDSHYGIRQIVLSANDTHLVPIRGIYDHAIEGQSETRTLQDEHLLEELISGDVFVFLKYKAEWATSFYKYIRSDLNKR